MANTDKDILITPNRGSSNEPKIEFKGASSAVGPSTITATIYPTNNGTLSFDGTEGSLFSIANNLTTGSIFSVNPISGIPIIDVNADRTIALNPYGGNTGIGLTNPSYKLDVNGTARFSGQLTIPGNNSILFGPNSTWSRYLRIGGNGWAADSTTASVVTTDGNLHLDAADANHGIYLNWYGGTNGTFFGNGAAGQIGRLDGSGNFSVSGTITGTQITSNIANGTAPFVVSSTTKVTNLNADYLDDQTGSYYLDYNNFTNTPTIGNGTITVEGTTGLTGSGSFTVNQTGNTTVTLNHADTSSQASVDNSNGTVIQDVTLDEYGHVTGLASVDLDGRYYTETESDARFLGISAKAADADKLDGQHGSYYLDTSNTTQTKSGNLKITALSESWAEGVSVSLTSSSAWGGYRLRRERVGNDGNWAFGYTALDSTDDLVFSSNNNGSQVDNILRLTKTAKVGVNNASPLQALDVRGNFLLAADATTATHITQKPYTVNGGTLSWEGSAGQLFSITNNLTSGSIFSVNDVSGLPSIDVDANGTILFAPYGGNIGLGTLTPTQKLHVVGSSIISGTLGLGVDSAVAKLHTRVSTPTSIGSLPSGVTGILDSSSNNYLLFRNSADNGTYSGIAMQDNNVGGYVIFGNAGGGGDLLYVAGYGGGQLQYGTADSINPSARTTVASWNSTGLQINNGDLRAPIYRDSDNTDFYLNPASTTTSLQIAGAIEQGNNFAHPNIEWSYAGASTGRVVFKLPGDSGNYGMVHMVFDYYEYNSPRTATIIVSGHNWNGAWYNTACNIVGYIDKPVYLGFIDGQYCVCFGDFGSTWSYGTIRLRKIHNGSFYNNVMDLGGAYTVSQITIGTFSNISSDLRRLMTSNAMYAYEYRGHSNVAGTGEATYHPAGVYSTGTNWLYGSIITNNNSIDAGTANIDAAKFRDSNNTTYEFDGTGTTRLSRLRVFTNPSADWDAIEIYTDGVSGYIQGFNDESGLRIRSQNGNILLADDRGSVGINNTLPLQKLDVRGNFLLAADSTTATHITQKPYTINGGTLSWEGSEGQLFSIANNLTTGSIFSVNPISGIPIIDVNADRTIALNPYGGNTGIGLTNPSYKLDVNGTSRFSGASIFSSNISLSNGYIRAITNNQPAILSVANGSASTGASFAIQQETAEGWTGIFVDYEPYTGWGLYHDNPNNYFCVTSESSTGSLRSFTVPSRSSGNRTAYEKIRFNQNDGSLIAGGTVTAPTFSGSLSGNATTATTATNLSGFTNSNFSSPVAADSVTNNGIAYVNSNIALYSQTDGALYSQAYSSSWIHQIYGDYRTGQIAIRGKNSGTWQSWRTVLDSSNWSSYVTAGATLSAGSGSQRVVLTDLTTGSMTSAATSSALLFDSSTGTLSSTIFTSTSDITKKTNIQNIKNAVELTKQINGVKFDWKETSESSAGVIAQEVEEILPEIVHTNDEGIKSVNYNGVVGLLVEAIKEQQKQIDELNKELKKLHK